MAQVISTINGTCTKVVDGDTFEVTDNLRNTTHIRLANVDAPEMNEVGGVTAKQRLSDLLHGKTVRCDVVAYSYGRSVAEVYVGAVYVNEVMRGYGYR